MQSTGNTNNLTIGTGQSGSNLDTILDKLNKIQSAIDKINKTAVAVGGAVAMGGGFAGVPNAAPGSAASSAGAVSLAPSTPTDATSQAIFARASAGQGASAFSVMSAFSVTTPGPGGAATAGYTYAASYQSFQPMAPRPNAPGPSPFGYGPSLSPMQQVGMGAAAGVAHIGGQALNYQTDLARNGGADPMGRNALIGTGLSAAIGIGVGIATRNPIVGAEVAGIAAQILPAFGRYLGVGEANQNDSRLAITPFISSVQGKNSRQAREALVTHFDALESRYPGSGMPQWMQPTSAQIADVYSNISSGLFAGGVNPFAPNGDFHYGSEDGDREMARARGMAGRRSMSGKVEALDSMSKAYAYYKYAGQETTGETYTRRLTNIFGKTAVDVSKNIAPIFATLPESGGNTSDILLQHGAQSTSAYLRIQNESGVAAVDAGTLMLASAGFRGGERTAQIGSLQARGSGAAALTGYRSAMESISGLPDGKSSLAYAGEAAKARAAEATDFEQRNAVSFGVPRAHLDGALQRANFLPFNPSQTLSMEIRRIGLDRNEYKSVDAYMRKRRAEGNLSEDEELSLTQRMEGLRTDAAAGMGTLALGMENRLPAMTGGRPTFFRGSSNTLAALRSQNTPVRIYGSVNGKDKQAKDDWINSVDADFGTTPVSRTAGVNNAEGTGAIVAAINRLSDAILGGGKVSGGQRRHEAANNALGSLTNGAFGRKTAYPGAN